MLYSVPNILGLGYGSRVGNDHVSKVAAFLRPEDFSVDEPPRWVYEACLSLYRRNESINQVTIAHELDRQNSLERVGGTAYLSHLIYTVPTSVHIEDYAQIVSRLAVMRRLISAAGEIAALGYQADSDVDTTLSQAEETLFRVKQRQPARDLVPLRDALDQYLEEAGTKRAPGEGEEAPHALTGFAALDGFLGGL